MRTISPLSNSCKQTVNLISGLKVRRPKKKKKEKMILRALTFDQPAQLWFVGSLGLHVIQTQPMAMCKYIQYKRGDVSVE